MSTVPFTVDFSSFPDNMLFPVAFQMGMTFHLVDPTAPPPFVNATGAERGLQFPPSGLQIDFPTPVASAGVRLRTGGFAGPVQVRTLDSDGNTIASVTVLPPNSFVNQTLAGPGIAGIVLEGAGSEGLLVKITIDLEVFA